MNSLYFKYTILMAAIKPTTLIWDQFRLLQTSSVYYSYYFFVDIKEENKKPLSGGIETVSEMTGQPYT